MELAEEEEGESLQKELESGIKELETKLASAEVIDPTRLTPSGKVVFGTWVQLWEEAGDREVTYQIVGELEADIDQGMISHSSPIARALIGRTSGDEVEFTAPDGTRRYEILAVRCTNVETASND